jgi:hypothetical protein
VRVVVPCAFIVFAVFIQVPSTAEVFVPAQMGVIRIYNSKQEASANLEVLQRERLMYSRALHLMKTRY